MADSPAAAAASRGWAFLQSGDLRTAEREFVCGAEDAAGVLSRGDLARLLELARKDAKAALPHFDRALELNPQKDDVSAFLGRATGADGAQPGRRRAVGLRSGAGRRSVADRTGAAGSRCSGSATRSRESDGRARPRAPAGSTRRRRRTPAAIASSPDSAFLYRELAAVERQKGERRRRARAFPQGRVARSATPRRSRRSASCSRRAATSTARSRRTATRGHRAERGPREAARRGARQDRAGAAARGVSRDRPGAADHARRSGGADRHPAERRC